MKRLIIFVIILSVSFAACSPFIEFQHEEFQPGETLLAEIRLEEGEFTKQISEGDIKFFEGRREVFFETEIIFYRGTHYLYVYLPRRGNFSMRIENVLYRDGETLGSKTLTEQIYVEEKEVIKENTSFTEIVSVRPGLVFLEKEPKVRVVNVGNASINFTIDYPNGSDEEVSLSPMDAKEFNFSPEGNVSFFKVNSYKEFLIPIIYPQGEIFVPATESDLRTSKELILKNIIVEEKTEEIIQLFNFGDSDLTDLSAVSDLDFVTFDELGEIYARESRNFSVYFNPENPGHFTGEINIKYNSSNGSGLARIQLSLFVLPKGSDEEEFIVSQKTCAELNGTICTLEEYCDGNATFSKGGDYCCLANCEEIETEEPGGSTWLIGMLILLVLGIGGYFLYSKSKKVRRIKPEERMKEISEKYRTTNK